MNRIKELRKGKGMKQTDLARQLGVTQGALSGWENENYEPDIKALKKMSEIFGVSVRAGFRRRRRRNACGAFRAQGLRPPYRRRTP